MTEEKLTYEQAVQELEDILEALEKGDVGIDELNERVKRAAYLLDHCRRALREVEESVMEVIKNMEAEDSDETENAAEEGPF